MRKVAVVCGIAGGVWALLAPILVLLPIYVRVSVSPVTGKVGEEEVTSMLEAGAAGDVLPIFGLVSLIGTLGLLAIVLRNYKPRLAKPLLWTSAIALLLLSLAGIFSIGLLFLPAPVLLLVAAFGLRSAPGRGKSRLRGESPLPLSRES